MAVPFHYLLIDDNPQDHLLAQEAFDYLCPDCKLTCVSNGQEALRLLRSHGEQPDVLLLDINMPGMNGFDILKTVKEDAQLRHIPVVMLTTSGAREDISKAYSLFASSYLVKSTSFDDFLRQIEAFLKYWQASRVSHGVA
ncbi:response regulator [Deinococcus hohokamensis]|uniref:Response regulator n=1 Tax=Deinococcus hohokamensis TaxID=309883 RepID=A0ABV9I3L0_9DEIO